MNTTTTATVLDDEVTVEATMRHRVTLERQVCRLHEVAETITDMLDRHGMSWDSYDEAMATMREAEIGVVFALRGSWACNAWLDGPYGSIVEAGESQLEQDLEGFSDGDGREALGLVEVIS